MMKRKRIRGLARTILFTASIILILTGGYAAAGGSGGSGPNDLICLSAGCTTGFAHYVDKFVWDSFYNTAIGDSALANNTPGTMPDGWFNTAVGINALLENVTGNSNTGFGSNALRFNTFGNENTAVGEAALVSNDTANGNTAVGTAALDDMKGYYNTAIGVRAGSTSYSGNNNIYIGYEVWGVNGESGVIRIGKNQSSTFISGISGAPVTGGAPIYVGQLGQLGTVASSRRFKEDISDMGETSDRLMKLRPVTFHYKADAEPRTLQYGLIAEEVAEVYPELVQYGADSKPVSVRYDLLGPMLLNEIKKQQKKIDREEKEIDTLRDTLNGKEARIRKLEETIMEMERRLAGLEAR